MSGGTPSEPGVGVEEAVAEVEVGEQSVVAVGACGRSC